MSLAWVHPERMNSVKVLIVDDEPEHTSLLAGLLKRIGIREYLMKPLGIGVLAGCVQRVLNEDRD